MPLLWPFGRNRRRGSRGNTTGPDDLREGKQPVKQYEKFHAGPAYEQTPDPQAMAPGRGTLSRELSTRETLSRELSRKKSQRKRRNGSPKMGVVGNDDGLHNNGNMQIDSQQQRRSSYGRSKPLDVTSGQTHFTRGSSEDITALPVTRQLGTSPHLRPVTQDRANIPYNFHTPSRSNTSIPRVSEKPKKLQRRPSTFRSKPSDGETSALVPRRKSHRRKKEEQLREEEIRAMSAPMQLKRPITYSGGLLRRDSKRVRNGLNRHFERPTSNISLPLEDSIHSSMSGNSEQHAFTIKGLDVFSPRPTIRYSGTPQYGSSAHNGSGYVDPPRADSRREKRPVVDDGMLADSRTMDDLADDLDAAALRELMERDQRRRDKKRKNEEERIKRRLARRAERQRTDEERAAARDVSRGRNRGRMGLGIAAEPAVTPASRSVRDMTEALPTPPTLPPQEAIDDRMDVDDLPLASAKSPFADPSPVATKPEEPTPTETPFSPPTETPFTAPFVTPMEAPFARSSEVFATPLEAPLRTPLESPAMLQTPLESPFEEPVVGMAQAIRMSTATISPPTSPVHSRGPSNISVLPDLLSRAQEPRKQELLKEESPARVLKREVSIDVPSEGASSSRRGSELSARKLGTWTSIFRRVGTGRRSSSGKRSNAPSELSFSNTSRDSMSRQAPQPLYLQQRSVRESSAPVRARSKFREDLPGVRTPLSPPQSPEAELPTNPIDASAESAPSTVRVRRGKEPTIINTAQPGEPSLHSSSSGRNQAESPISPHARAASALMSQSLASVDSEGSWLSGKPMKRGSFQRSPSVQQVRASIGSLPKQAEDPFSASYEELGMPDDEYFKRLTPNPEHMRREEAYTGREGSLAHKASSTALAEEGAEGDSDEEDYSNENIRDSEKLPPRTPDPVVHSSLGRQPTLVHRDSKVKSREGLLNDFHHGEEGVLEGDPFTDNSADITPDQEEKYSEGDDSPVVMESTWVSRAKSIDYGKRHARHLSAGSAKLLDIPSRRASTAGIHPETQ